MKKPSANRTVVIALLGIGFLGVSGWCVVVGGLVAYNHHLGRLFRAVSNDDAESVKRLISESPELLELRDPVGLTPLHQAAWHGKLEAMQALIQSGADLNATWDGPAYQEGGYTALHVTAISGQSAAADILIGRGVDVNQKSWLGQTALDLAERNGHVRLIRVLRSHGGLKGSELPAQKP